MTLSRLWAFHCVSISPRKFSISWYSCLYFSLLGSRFVSAEPSAASVFAAGVEVGGSGAGEVDAVGAAGVAARTRAPGENIEIEAARLTVAARSVLKRMNRLHELQKRLYPIQVIIYCLADSYCQPLKALS